MNMIWLVIIFQFLLFPLIDKITFSLSLNFSLESSLLILAAFLAFGLYGVDKTLGPKEKDLLIEIMNKLNVESSRR